MSEQNNANIQGEPIPYEELLALMGIDDQVDPSEIESAIIWWDRHASVNFIGALDSEPVEGE